MYDQRGDENTLDSLESLSEGVGAAAGRKRKVDDNLQLDCYLLTLIHLRTW